MAAWSAENDRRIEELQATVIELRAEVAVLGLQVGDDSGIEADNLEFCLEALLSSAPFNGAKPVIERLPGDVLRLSYLEVEDGDPDD